VYKGVIYNYQSLRSDLIKRGHTFRTQTDTEVTVHLYEEFGESCVNHLRGRFAIAIWDTRQKRLFAARLPVRMKVRGRSLRYIQTRLAERYLPKDVLNRAKQGFSSAIPYMLKNEYRLSFRRFLNNSRLAAHGLFQQATSKKILDNHLSGPTDHGN